MARTPTVYRWDDPGAPDIATLLPTNNDKDKLLIHTVLKSCLVDGYGTKAAAGWTMPLEETTATGNRFVLTNVANSGSLLYEGGSFSGGGSYAADTLWACSAVPDMDNPVNAWSYKAKYEDRNSGARGIFHKTGLRFRYSATGWVVIANENTAIVVFGSLSDFSNSYSSSIGTTGSAVFMFGAMNDGFSGIFAPSSGNFYIGGGGYSLYEYYYGSSENLGFNNSFFTSVVDILGLEKSAAHSYSYSNVANAIKTTYSSLSAWLPAPIVYYQYGPSAPDGNSSSRLHFAAALPGIRKLLLCPQNIATLNSFMTSNGFEYGEPFTYQGADWVAFKAYDGVVNIVSLDPAEWGA